MSKVNTSMHGSINKIDEDRRMVYGWASVIKENGKNVVDHHGDMIEETTLVRAVEEFMKDVRAGGVMHLRNENGKVVRIGKVIESVVFTEELQKSLGIDIGKVGWFVGLHVEDDSIWKMVQDGTLKAFSIGGIGTREDS